MDYQVSRAMVEILPMPARQAMVRFGFPLRKELPSSIPKKSRSMLSHCRLLWSKFEPMEKSYSATCLNNFKGQPKRRSNLVGTHLLGNLASYPNCGSSQAPLTH